MLVTQNIDDLHTLVINQSQILNTFGDPRYNVPAEARIAFSPHVYEIHGNVKYMHCSNEDEDCSRVFHLTPSLETFNNASDNAPANFAEGK